MFNAKVLSTGFYVPEEVINNSFFTDGKPWFFYDLNGDKVIDSETNNPKQTFLTDEKILKISGITQRRKSKLNEFSQHLGYNAAIDALKNANISVNELEGIIVANVTQESQFPSTATMIQDMLGATNVKEAYDVGNACAGFPLALDIAATNIKYKNKGPHLVIGAETLTKIIDYKGRDINTNLFGDGAGAMVVVPSNEDKGIIASSSLSDPHDGKLNYIVRQKGILRMSEGPLVLKNAVSSMAYVTLDLLKKTGWCKEDIDYFAFHQANNNITNLLTKRLKVDSKKVGNNIHMYGNMSAATVPILIAQAMKNGEIKEGYKVILAAFGSGLVTHGNAVKF